VRIGVDATCWGQRRGYGRHLRALLSAAAGLDRRHQYVLFFDSEPPTEAPAGAQAVRVQTSEPTLAAARSDGHRRLADLWAMSRAMSSPELDCLLFPTLYSYVPVWSRAYKIVVIHDVIPERYPQWIFRTAAARLNWKMKSLAARRQADLILTVSEYSRRQLLEYFGESPGRVRVVGEAGDPVFRVIDRQPLPERLEKLGLGGTGSLLVFVGGFDRHKNLHALLDAFAAVLERPGLADTRLALVGDYEAVTYQSCFGEVRDRMGRPPLAGKVIATGYLPDQELVVLLNAATALVLPSLLEGFGLPAFEAAACGLPVVATTASPVPELLGPEGGLWVDPRDTAALGQALERILSDAALRGQLGENGRAAAARLSWESAAGQLLEVFDAIPSRHAQAA